MADMRFLTLKAPARKAFTVNEQVDLNEAANKGWQMVTSFIAGDEIHLVFTAEMGTEVPDLASLVALMPNPNS